MQLLWNIGSAQLSLCNAGGVCSRLYSAMPPLTLLDSDKQGYLRADPSTGSGQVSTGSGRAGPIVLTGGSQLGDNHVFSGTDANGINHLYTFVTGDRNSGGDLVVDGAMLIKGYDPNAGNQMGITLDGPVAPAANDSVWRVAA